MDLLLMDAYSLAFDLTFADLGADAGLARLDRLFLTALADDDAALAGRLLAARATPDALDAKAEGELIVDLGASLEAFLAGLFGVEAEIAAIAGRTAALDPIHACKRLFVQRQAVRNIPRRKNSTAPRCAPAWKRRWPSRSPRHPSPPMSPPGKKPPMPACWTARCATPPGRP